MRIRIKSWIQSVNTMRLHSRSARRPRVVPGVTRPRTYVVYDTLRVATMVWAGPRLDLLGLGVRVPVRKEEVSTSDHMSSEEGNGGGQIGAKDKMIVSQHEMIQCELCNYQEYHRPEGCGQGKTGSLDGPRE